MRTFIYFVFFYTLLPYDSFSLNEDYVAPRNGSKRYFMDRIKSVQKLKTLDRSDSNLDILGLGNQAHQLQPPRRTRLGYKNMMEKIDYKHKTSPSPNDFLRLNIASCISTYCVIAKERLKQRCQERADREKLTVASITRKSLYSVFIEMHDKGQLSGADTSADLLKTSFHGEVQQGSAFIIGNCHLSISYAKSNQNNTVVTLLMDEESAARCQRLISKKKLTNIFLLVMEVKQLGEQLLSSELFSIFMNFDSLIIEEIGKIAEGLLPHEVEKLMSQMLQVSHQTIISFSQELEPEKLNYFESVWQRPVDLINNICARISNSNCSIKKIGLGDSWKLSTFSVHLKKDASKEETNFKDCGIPLQYLLSINMTQASKDALFLLLITSRINFDKQTNLFVKGQQVLDIQVKNEVEAKELSIAPSLRLDKSDKFPSLSKRLSSYFNGHRMKNSILKTKDFEDFKKNEKNQIKNYLNLRDGFRDPDLEPLQQHRFEDQWNREDSGRFQKVLNDIKNNKENALRQTENKSFDIVDGRPIEEQKKIADAYNFLKSSSLRYASIKGHLSETKMRDGKSYESQNGDDSIVNLKKSKATNLYPQLIKARFPVKQGNVVQQRGNVNQKLIPSNYSESGKKQVFNLKQQKKTGIPQLITAGLKASDKSLIWATRNDNPKMRNNLEGDAETRRKERKLLMMPPSWTQMPAKLALNQIPFASLNDTERQTVLNHLLHMYSKSNGFTSSAVTTSPAANTLKPHQHGMNIKSCYLKLCVDYFDCKFDIVAVKADSHKGSLFLSTNSEKVSSILLIKGSPRASNEDVYQCMKNIIIANLRTFLRPSQISSALISGDCAFSMLSTKLAMLYPRISLITLKSIRTPKCQDDIRPLLESNFHFNENLDPDIVYQMSHTPQLFDFQIISSHIFSWLLQMGEDFKHYMADILSLSKVSFIEVANWPHLISSSKFFGHSNFMRKNLEEFLNEVFNIDSSWIRYFKIEDISTSLWKSLKGSSIYRIELSSIQRKVYTSCTDQLQMPSNFYYERTKSMKPQKKDKAFHFHQNGLNLKMLLSFELDSAYRKRMFVNYIKLNRHKDMCPSKLYWSQGKLWHQEDNMSVQHQHQSIKEITQVLNEEIHQNSFSFMDYNSPNRHVGTNLAQLHPNSTFILAHPSSSEAAKKLQEIKSQNLENTIPLDLPISNLFTEKFVKSPDILRYQYFDYVSLLQSTYNKNEIKVNIILGDMLATGLTTFITMPSAEILSLAATTLYPTIFAENDTVSDVVPFFENAEQKLLMQSISAGFKIQLHTTLRPVVSSPDGGHKFWYPWSLLSLRIMNLKLEIDHHFMFELDGHMRKYIQHVERKEISSPPVVYLVREEDSYRINYGNVNAISLIALLRMGLLSSMKEEWYQKFLRLPLYEDMAPWNIVFRGGELDYIDQDTRDSTLEKFVPLAYQTMSALMNYQRTVHDFGHCKGTARTAYDIHYIASCVESAFRGPCPDSRYPVPCGDKSCKSSYIECLRAMNKRMIDANDSHGRREAKNSSHKKKSTFTNIWSFDGKGKTQIE